MAKAKNAGRLADYERRYRRLAAAACRHRIHFVGQHHAPLHPMRDARLQVSRRPAAAARPLLPMDRQDQR